MRRAAALLGALAALAAPGSAAAAGTLEVGIADDAAVLHEPDEARARAVVERWRSLGVESVRLFAEWYKVVPGPLDVRRPEGFDPGDPDDPQYGWSKLDRAVRLVREAGLRPVLAVTGPGPVWASEEPARRNPRWRPSPAQFGVFASAVARRFGASVDRYVLWNEPNLPLWLQPQATCTARRCTPFSAHHYRRLVRAAQPVIEAADPSAQVLVGALAPRGSRLRSRNAQMRPLHFLRALGCVSRTFRRDRSGPCRRFRPLTADAVAHHPHSVLRAPDEPSDAGDDANLADVPRLVQTLDRIQAAGGLRRRGGKRFPLHLTEWGYQTNPPDRLLGVSRTLQARYLQQGAYIAWRTPRVRSLVHYLWRDEPVRPGAGLLTGAAGWQSGLLTEDGRPKRAARTFDRPFWVDPRPDGTARLWGHVRTRDATEVVVQARRAGRWHDVATAVPDAFGYWTLVTRLGTRAVDHRFVAGGRASAALPVPAMPRPPARRSARRP